MQRLQQLDQIRGLAVLALILINIYAFALPPDYSHSLRLPGITAGSLDIWLYNLQTLFIKGRFITLFSVLFGVSLLLIVEKYGTDYLRRRLYWLVLLGALHGWFLWFGDILLWYALTGLWILKRNYFTLDSAQLWRKAIRFFLIGLILPLMLSILILLDSSGIAPDLADTETFAQQIALWTGPYWPQVVANLTHSLLVALLFAFSALWHTAALMLLGMALYKSQWFNTGYNMGMTFKLFFGSLLLSLSIVWLDQATDYLFSLNSILPWAYLAEVMMALAFASWLIQQRASQWPQRWLAPCGKLALTLYISQTVLMVLLFRVLRPEWFATLDRLQLTTIALLMLLLQLGFSQLYLRYYQQGPLEWCWRRLSQKPAQPDNTSSVTAKPADSN